MKVLLTFTGFHDPYAVGLVGEEEQPGPILSLVGAKAFDRVILFSTPGVEKNTLAVREALHFFPASPLLAVAGAPVLGSVMIPFCSLRLPNIIPHGMCVRLVRWRQKDGGEKLHNRYILTDKGGVSLGVGLDDGTPGETDEIKLLDEETYKFRWKQYTSEPAFDLVDEVVVEGRRTLRA